jgi:hypothetical protein
MSKGHASKTVPHKLRILARKWRMIILVNDGRPYSALTIAGLCSLATGLGGKSLLWGPVATGMVFGLFVATILTLFLVPVLFQSFM